AAARRRVLVRCDGHRGGRALHVLGARTGAVLLQRILTPARDPRERPARTGSALRTQEVQRLHSLAGDADAVAALQGGERGVHSRGLAGLGELAEVAPHGGGAGSRLRLFVSGASPYTRAMPDSFGRARLGRPARASSYVRERAAAEGSELSRLKLALEARGL